ncbi:tape measure protein [Acinetobacter towneri]|uniref:tape measure protein n=1 Tax=Acinetobacter towneri TaxID=202956 RepID=UPI002578FDCD|nr:tape measure protein [Acinetobacter towneri]MDM1282413.1 tape measure protein [Acinetobacter towneri]
MAQESVLRIVIDSRNAERNARALANELGSIEKKGDFASKSMDSMSVATRQLAGYMAGVVTVGAAISKMDAYTGMQNRLKLVTESQEQLNLAMSDTFSIAQKSYQSWDSVIQVYQRFSDNAKTLRIDMAKTAELTETVSKAVAISGASTQAAEAALTQFGQALASGVLRGEELNSILEQTPALAKAIAQGMGITVGQLRSVAAEGKITGDVLVDALTKSKQSVDELFAKTDITIGQSIQLLSNEVTKFTGEAGKASGVATTLASSIQILANNLDAIAGIAVVGGVALLTKTIAAQTVAIHGSISAVVAKRAADAAALQSQVQLAAVEVQRTRQVTALALTEINLARQELNSATTRQARAAATMRLTQAEIAHSIALKQSAAAVATQTAAENALNVSRSRSAMLLGLVGGPIGALTIGVAALTAGYMYLQNRTAEANAKLEEQGQIANKTNAELEKLAGNDKVSAVNDLTAAFNSQNEALSKSKEAVDAVLFAIRASSVENERARKITEDARNGVISYTDAIKLLNNEKISVDLYNKLKDQADQYDENSRKAANTQRALAALKVEVDLAGNAMQNAAGKARDKANAMNEDANATRDAAQANRDYTASLQQKLFDQAFITRLVTKHNKTQQEANLLLEAHKKTNGQISAQDKELIAGITAQQKALENYGKAQSTTSKARTSAAKSQAKEERSATRDAERAAQERLQIEYQYADDLRKGYLNLDAEIKRIIESGADSSFIQKAKDRHNFEEELYLRSLTEQINAHKWSEEEKLIFAIETQKLIANESGKYNDDHKQAVLDSLDAQRDYELAQIKLAKEMRIFQAEQAMMSEMQIIQKRYALEYAEISRINDSEKRGRRMNAATYSKKMDEDNLRWNTTLNYNNAIGVDTSAVQALKARQDAIDAMYQEGFIKQKEYEAASLASRQQYDRDLQSSALSSLNTMLSATSSTWSNMTQLVKDGAGEQSGAYKAMFLVQQAFAMTTATINALMAYNQVLANPWTFDPISKQVAASITLGMGMANVGMIAAQTIAGFANGGYTGHGGKYEPAGIVHKGEGVLTQEEIKALGGPQGFEDLRKSIRRGYATGGLVTDTHRVGMGAVSAINSGGANSSSSGGGGDVNITVHVTDSGVSTQSNQNEQKQLGQMIGNAVRTIIRQEQRQGGLLSK